MGNFTERLNFLMDNVLKVSANAMAGDINASVSSILRYKNGINQPPQDFIEKVCKFYGVSANWLVLNLLPIKLIDLP